jgi:hypothetical protein
MLLLSNLSVFEYLSSQDYACCCKVLLFFEYLSAQDYVCCCKIMYVVAKCCCFSNTYWQDIFPKILVGQSGVYRSAQTYLYRRTKFCKQWRFGKPRPRAFFILPFNLTQLRSCGRKLPLSSGA